MDRPNSIEIRALTLEDLPAVVALHQESFPDYLSTLAGPVYLKTLYGTFIEEPKCLALGAFLDGRLVGLATGHSDRAAFRRQVFKRYPFLMAALFAWRFLWNGAFRRKAWRRRGIVRGLISSLLTEETERVEHSSCPIRLVSLAVAAGHRRRHIGTALIEEYCRRLANAGAPCVGLSVSSSNESAIAFYERSGWVREREAEDGIYYRRDVVTAEESAAHERVRVAQRYQRRAAQGADRKYSPILPEVLMAVQERQRALVRWIRTCGIEPVADKRVLEVGCGAGGFLLDLHRLGFPPKNLTGNELIEERAAAARENLPAAVRVITGDACEIPLSEGPFDIVIQSTVFTSILDQDVQQRLADRMWALTRPGGGVLWYDFIYDNPKNQDVRGVPLDRVRALFPHGQITTWRLTLAPPLARLVARIHPALYLWFNLVPWLRTHVLCWIRKEASL
jgi:ribosomal protein S18 acetylase RimI-like enzyme